MESDIVGNAIWFSCKDNKEIEDYLTDKLDHVSDDPEQENKINLENEEINVINSGYKSPDSISPLNYTENKLSLTTGRTTLSQRLFSPVEPGSIRGSIFNMAILGLGTGCLSLPKVISEMSLVLGLIGILVIGLATIWTLSILSITSEKCNCYNYSKLTRIMFGNVVGLIFDIAVLICVFGILVLYTVVINKTLGEIVYNIGGFYNEYNKMEDFISGTNSFWSNRLIKISVMLGVAICFIIPLCLLNDVSKLRWASLLGVSTIISIILMIITQCPFYFSYYWDEVYKEEDTETHLNILSVGPKFKALNFINGITSFLFCYNCHIGAIPIFNTLKNNVKRRVNKVLYRTIIMDYFIYTTISVCGYLTWPINTPPLIVGRENISGGVDIMMTLARICLVVTLIVKLPNNYNSFRISFFEMFFQTSEITKKRNVLLTICTFFIVVLVAVIYDEVLGYIKIIGGFCSTFLGYLLPGLLYIKGNGYEFYNWKNLLTLFIVMILSTIGFLSGTVTLVDIISDHKH